MPVTYTVTESDGFKHTRTSVGHNAPEYFWAVVRVPHGGKADISFSSRRELAEANLQAAMTAVYRCSEYAKARGHKAGERIYPEAALYPVEAVVKTPGGRKVEADDDRYDVTRNGATN